VSSFAALILATALAGCGSTPRDAFHPVMISGDDARTMLDRDAGAMLAARHPGLLVGPTRCPFLMNLTGGSLGTCTIPVAGGTMRVGVASDGYMHTFFLPHDIDALVVRRDAEPQLADDLRRAYGVPFTVRCEGAQVRILPVDEHFTCAIEGAGVAARRVDVVARDRDGRLRFRPLRHSETLVERVLGIDAASRTRGTIVIAGSRAERYLHETAGESLHGELVRRQMLGGVFCPPRIVLSQRSHVRCTVRAGDRVVSYILSFGEGHGLAITPVEHIVIVPALQQLAQRFVEQRVRPAPVTHVTCGHERVITVDEEADVRCKATYGGRVHTVSAQFSGEDGYDVSFGIQGDSSPSLVNIESAP
jgi:hypothetical protein